LTLGCHKFNKLSETSFGLIRKPSFHTCNAAVYSHFNFSGVLTEICDPNDACDLDARSFKGIFVRNLRYLMDADAKNRDVYAKFIRRNVEALMANASCNPEENR
jgi:hypothetical protein